MYQGVLFSLDGYWITDFKGETKEEVIEALADRGSRWFFYPFDGVTTSYGSVTRHSQRVIDMPPQLEFLKGKSIKTVANYIKAHARELCQEGGD